MTASKKQKDKPRVVIIGGGFGGLYAAKALANTDVAVTLVDRKNHHTFQPLLYQVATSVLSPGEIALTLRHSLSDAKNIKVLLGEVVEINKNGQRIKLSGGGQLEFDYLIVAAGARHSYFGNDHWAQNASGLKTIEDAIEIRRQILSAFENAESEAILTGTHQPLHFAIIGGGPTGVELAGAIVDISRKAMAEDFRAIDPTQARISIFQGSERVLGMFSANLSEKAKKQLEELGVEIHTDSRVSAVEKGQIKVGDKWIPTTLTLWATGVAASPLGKQLSTVTDRAGCVPVEPDLSIPEYRNIFVVGDMASLKDKSGIPVPSLASAAIQEGKSAAKNILRDLRGEGRQPFKFKDKGLMATIGRHRAIVQFGKLELSGVLARMLWDLVHVSLLEGARNRSRVVREWLWAHTTRERSARLITENIHSP